MAKWLVTEIQMAKRKGIGFPGMDGFLRKKSV